MTAARPVVRFSPTAVPVVDPALQTATLPYTDAGVAGERPPLGFLDDFAKVHNNESIRDVMHQCQIVGDDEITNAKFGLQRFEQRHDLRLHGNVQPGHRFIGDQDLRL